MLQAPARQAAQSQHALALLSKSQLVLIYLLVLFPMVPLLQQGSCIQFNQPAGMQMHVCTFSAGQLASLDWDQALLTDLNWSQASRQKLCA